MRRLWHGAAIDSPSRSLWKHAVERREGAADNPAPAACAAGPEAWRASKEWRRVLSKKRPSQGGLAQAKMAWDSPGLVELHAVCYGLIPLVKLSVFDAGPFLIRPEAESLQYINISTGNK